MMYVAPLLVIASLMVEFTALNGRPLFVRREAVVEVSEPVTCDRGAGASLTINGGPIGLCVRETVREAVSKLSD